MVTTVKTRSAKRPAPESDDEDPGDEFALTQTSKDLKKQAKKKRKAARRAATQPAAAVLRTLFFLKEKKKGRKW